jgi:hypothetical protein
MWRSSMNKRDVLRLKPGTCVQCAVGTRRSGGRPYTFYGIVEHVTPRGGVLLNHVVDHQDWKVTGDHVGLLSGSDWSRWVSYADVAHVVWKPKDKKPKGDPLTWTWDEVGTL